MYRLLVFCALFPALVHAVGLQASFSGTNLSGLTRSLTIAEYDASIDVHKNLLDRSGRKHDLVPSGNAGTGESTFIDSSGRKLRAVTFTASEHTAYSITHSDFGLFNKNFTLTVLFKVDVIADNQVLLQFGDSSTGGFAVYITSTGQIRATWDGSVAAVSNNAVEAGYWNVLQIVRNKDIGHSYLNGLVSSPVDLTNHSVDTAATLFVGGVTSETTGYLTGAVAYLRIDAEALSIERIQYEYNHILGVGSNVYTSFYRSTVAYQVNADASLSFVAVGIPSISDGIRIEGQNTNFALHSKRLEFWNLADVSILQDNMDAPDGTITADGLIANAENNIHGVTQAVPLSSGEYTISVFAKPGIMNWILIADANALAYFNVKNCISGKVHAGVSFYTATSYSNGWCRCQMRIIGTNAVDEVKVLSAVADGKANFSGDAKTVNVWLWGPQVEDNPFSSSYIETSSTPVTRTQDFFVVQPYTVGIDATKYPGILPLVLGDKHSSELTLEVEASCPYSTTVSKRVLLGITNYYPPETTNTKNAVEIYFGEDGKLYADIYDTNGTRHYVRYEKSVLAGNWHKYKFYVNLSDLSRSTFAVDNSIAGYRLNMTGHQNIDLSNSLIRLGQTYETATNSYVPNSYCSFRNLRVQPARF